MKFIKVKDKLLEKINQNMVHTIAVIDDQDNLSLDDEIEFFNSDNVSFGRAVIRQINIRKYSDIKADMSIRQLLATDYDETKLSDEHVKIIDFDYKPYDEPKSLRTNLSLETSSVKIYADGGSRGNPGPSASGYVIMTDRDELIKSNGVYLGITTNNQAEYKSIKFALEDAIEMGAKRVAVFMDSLLVVSQINGTYKVKNKDLMPIYADIKDLIGHFDTITFTHVPREFNKLADAEVNKCLDSDLNTAIIP